MSWGQALIEFRRTNKARSWSNFRAWDLKTDSKSAFATSLVGSRSPPLTTSFEISAFDMSRGTHPPTLPMSSRMHHFPNRRPPDHRIAHTSVSAAKRRRQHEVPNSRTFHPCGGALDCGAGSRISPLRGRYFTHLAQGYLGATIVRLSALGLQRDPHRSVK